MIVACWTNTTIGEFVLGGLAEIKTGPFGTQLHASDYVEEGTPVINVRNIGFGKIKEDKLEYIDDSTVDRLSSHILRVGDIVFGRKGAVERHVLIQMNQDRWFQGSDCLRLRISSDLLSKRFLSYCFLTEKHKQWMMNQCSHGATMASLNQDIIRRIPINLPPLQTQRKIASILSAYDDLIENNLRRIKILEEMAQNLYREWFVKFRFPGYENVKFVDSPLGKIPEGWEVVTIGSILKKHIGGGWGKESLHDKFTEKAWVIRGTDIPRAKQCSFPKVPLRWHTISNLSSRQLDVGDIVFEVSGGSKGQPLGRTFLVSSELFSAFNNDPVMCASFCKRVQPDAERCPPEFLYLSFLEAYESGEIEQYQVQSTGISNFKWTDYIKSVGRCIPSKEIRDQFKGIVSPIFSLINTLGSQNTNLRQTRDLLLPKLISGKLDVSDLDIKVTEDTA